MAENRRTSPDGSQRLLRSVSVPADVRHMLVRGVVARGPGVALAVMSVLKHPWTLFGRSWAASAGEVSATG